MPGRDLATGCSHHAHRAQDGNSHGRDPGGEFYLLALLGQQKTITTIAIAAWISFESASNIVAQQHGEENAHGEKDAEVVHTHSDGSRNICSRIGRRSNVVAPTQRRIA